MEPDFPFDTKAEVLSWLIEHCDEDILDKNKISRKSNMTKLKSMYFEVQQHKEYLKPIYTPQYVEGGLTIDSLNADTFFCIALQLEDLVDFIVCGRVCHAWHKSLRQTRLWKSAVLSLCKNEELIESLGRKYAGDYKAVFFAQLELWGKPVQTNSGSDELVEAIERLRLATVKKCLERGVDPHFPGGHSSNFNVRTPYEVWIKQANAKTVIDGVLCEILEALISIGGFNPFKYLDEPEGGRNYFNWENKEFENGKDINYFMQLYENYRPVPFAKRGWELKVKGEKTGRVMKFNLK